MSKTPYEIRLEILKLANEILTTPVYQKRSALEMAWSARREVNPNEPFPDMPDFPDTRDVIHKAAELRGFVDQQ